MIIGVIFNTFMTKETEGAGLCGVGGAGSAECSITGAFSAAQMAASLFSPCLPVPSWPLSAGVEAPLGISGLS